MQIIWNKRKNQMVMAPGTRDLPCEKLWNKKTLEEGLGRIGPVVEIVSAYIIYATENYWCSESPVITSDLLSEMEYIFGWNPETKMQCFISDL